MSIGSIVAAYDSSESAGRAFAFAAEMAARYGARLRVLAVVQLPEPPTEVEAESVREAAEEHFRSCFGGLSQVAERAGVRPEFEIRVGHAAEQIIHFAEEVGADVVVLGHRGRSRAFIERWRVGSISKRVVTYAHCTVIIVR